MTMTLGARAVTFRMPADERPTSPGREAKSSRKSAAPRKAKVGKEKVSPAKKEEKPRAASPKTKKRSSRIQAIAIDPSPNMSLAVINRTAPQGPPEGNGHAYSWRPCSAARVLRARRRRWTMSVSTALAQTAASVCRMRHRVWHGAP